MMFVRTYSYEIIYVQKTLHILNWRLDYTNEVLRYSRVGICLLIIVVITAALATALNYQNRYNKAALILSFIC